MAAGSRCWRLRSSLYPGRVRTTSIPALALPKRLAVGAAIRCPGRFAAVPGRGFFAPTAPGPNPNKGHRVASVCRC